MSKRRHILPDEPLPMEIPVTPIDRLNAATRQRDAHAAWLRERASHMEPKLRGAYRRAVAAVQSTARQRALAQAIEILESRRDWRAYGEIKRLYLFARLVCRLSPPPPQNCLLAA